MMPDQSRRTEAEKTVDRFMKLMAAREVYAAEPLFGVGSDAVERRRALASMDEGENYVLFEGYRTISTDEFLLMHAFGCMTSPSISMEGAVLYDDGSHGRFTAKLRRENGDWVLSAVNVTVPPTKLLHGAVTQ
jgi:hypothetical protein